MTREYVTKETILDSHSYWSFLILRFHEKNVKMCYGQLYVLVSNVLHCISWLFGFLNTISSP